jgi:hypothetical protein
MIVHLNYDTDDALQALQEDGFRTSLCRLPEVDKSKFRPKFKKNVYWAKLNL